MTTNLEQLTYGNSVNVMEVAQMLWLDRYSFLLVVAVVLIAVWLNSLALFLVNFKRKGIKYFFQTIAIRSVFYFGLLLITDCLHLFLGKWEIKLTGNLMDIYTTIALILLLKELKALVTNLIELKFDFVGLLRMLDKAEQKLEDKVVRTIDDVDNKENKE